MATCGVYLTVLASMAICVGCSAPRHSYTKRQFVLEVNRSTEAAAGSPQGILVVRRFSVDPTYESKGLMYRKGESEYQTDFYHEFLIAPEVIISGQTRNWMSQSGLFTTVLEPGSMIQPTHVLEGNILALYGDFREPASPRVVMEIRIFLIDNESSETAILFSRDYRASRPAEAQTPEALIAAFNQCLEQILNSLEEDISDAR
jgi:cholesterol transport system auxiliary component